MGMSQLSRVISVCNVFPLALLTPPQNTRRSWSEKCSVGICTIFPCFEQGLNREHLEKNSSDDFSNKLVPAAHVVGLIKTLQVTEGKLSSKHPCTMGKNFCNTVM